MKKKILLGAAFLLVVSAGLVYKSYATSNYIFGNDNAIYNAGEAPVGQIITPFGTFNRVPSKDSGISEEATAYDVQDVTLETKQIIDDGAAFVKIDK